MIRKMNNKNTKLSLNFFNPVTAIDSVYKESAYIKHTAGLKINLQLSNHFDLTFLFLFLFDFYCFYYHYQDLQHSSHINI